MSNFNGYIDESELDDIVYYNADYINNSDIFKKAIFSETRKDIIIHNPNLYYLSVVRWSIDLNDIPLMLYPSLEDGTPINSYYITSLTYLTNTYYGYVNYVSEDIKPDDIVPIPNPIYSIQHFLDMVNLAYRTAFNALKIDFPLLPYTDAPFLWYDIPNNRVNMIVPTYYITSNLVKVNMNSNLFTLFASFQFLYNSDDEIRNKEYQIVLKNTGNNTGTFQYPITSNNVASTIMYSAYNNVFNLNSLRKIVITTAKIPSAEQLITNYGFINSNSSSNETQRILSDYIVPNNLFTDFDSQLTFYPSAEFNMIDLKGSVPIKEIDLYFYWVDDNLNIFPIILFPRNGLSAKLMFRKKSYNSVKMIRILNNIKEDEENKKEHNKGGNVYKYLKY